MMRSFRCGWFFGVDRDDGDAAAARPSSRAWRLGLGLGFRRGKRAGERERVASAGFLYPEETWHGDSGGAVRWRRRGEALGRYRDDDEDVFLENPLEPFPLFCFLFFN